MMTLYEAYLMVSNQKILAQPSIWPLKRSLGKKSLKKIKPTVCSQNVEFLCQCSLSQEEFLNNFYIFIIQRYNIHNKIFKLDLLGNFYFWPHLEAIEKLFC